MVHTTQEFAMVLAHITGNEAPVLSATAVIAFLLGLVFGGLIVSSAQIWWKGRSK
jgi:hypothetical protein